MECRTDLKDIIKVPLFLFSSLEKGYSVSASPPPLFEPNSCLCIQIASLNAHGMAWIFFYTLKLAKGVTHHYFWSSSFSVRCWFSHCSFQNFINFLAVRTHLCPNGKTRQKGCMSSSREKTSSHRVMSSGMKPPLLLADKPWKIAWEEVGCTDRGLVGVSFVPIRRDFIIGLK